MKQIKIFTKNECSKCPAAKEVGGRLQEEGAEVTYYDLETPDGLAEAAFYSVLATPTIIVEDEHDTIIAGWRGSVPDFPEIKKVIAERWN